MERRGDRLRAVRHRRVPLRWRPHRGTLVRVHVRCMRQTGRLVAFSDSIFAIAATLLILDIQLPENGGSLTHELLRLWPSYGAYVISFIIIGIMWINHHAVFEQIDRIN